jgi:hypothetical protein
MIQMIPMKNSGYLKKDIDPQLICIAYCQLLPITANKCDDGAVSYISRRETLFAEKSMSLEYRRLDISIFNVKYKVEFFDS